MSRRRRRPTAPPGGEGAAQPAGEGPAAGRAVNGATPGGILLLAVTCALWTSLLELVPVMAAPYGNVTVRLPRDFAWMVPLGNLVFFGLLAAILLSATRLLPGRVTRGGVVGAYAALTTLALGSAAERIHPLAVLVLAVGVGAQAARMAAGPPRHRRLVAGMTAAAVVFLGGINLRIESREWRFESQWRGWLPIAPSGSPNIVLVILDTVRGASLPFLGDFGPQSPWSPARTPVLDSLSRRSVVFTRAIAPSPWTLPSHASMFTGRWPTELFGADRRGAEWMQGLDTRHPTVAEVLARRGYLTGGFVGNLAFTPWETGLARGFLEYRDYPRTPGQIVVSTALGRRLEANGVWRRLTGHHELLNRKSAAQVVDGFLRWREREGDRPYFAFLNFFDVHEPTFPPDSVKRAMPPGSRWDDFHHFAGLLTGTGALRAEKWAMDPAEQAAHASGYADALGRLDAEVGRLLEELDAHPSDNPTVVIITSDHGEQLGEHGLYDHNNSLYLPALHVPLMVLDPGAGAPSTVRDVVSLRDVGATILELAGVDPGEAGLGGRSLRRYWSGGGTEGSAAPPAFATLSRGSDNQPWYPVSWGPAMYALVDAEHHYILNGDGSEELYHLVTDPGQRSNRVDDPGSAAALARFRQALPRWVPDHPPFAGRREHPGPPGS